MNAFEYRRGQLMAERVPVQALAERYGTPLYIYSLAHLRAQYRALAQALAPVRPLLCYSMKANSNSAVLRAFLEQGAGLDIVSGGELYRAMRAGADPSKIVFAGVGKTAAEIDYALRCGILFFTVESEAEARRISARAVRLRRRARIAFRVNPDVDPQTHRYISTGKQENKFGLDLERARRACRLAARLPNVDLVGLHMHIGSQILSVQPFAAALRKVLDLCAGLRARHPAFRWLDIGGGIGIAYRPGQRPLDPAAYAARLLPGLRRSGLQIVLEPGRFLVGNAGLLVCRVQYLKPGAGKTFVVADAGMNDLIRPALYEAYHEVVPVAATRGRLFGDLVGPVCESGDFIAQERELPRVREGDLLAIRSAGAYGFAMASNYNSRPRPAEVLVDGAKARLIRKRETWEDLVRGEVVR